MISQLQGKTYYAVHDYAKLDGKDIRPGILYASRTQDLEALNAMEARGFLTFYGEPGRIVSGKFFPNNSSKPSESELPSANALPSKKKKKNASPNF